MRRRVTIAAIIVGASVVMTPLVAKATCGNGSTSGGEQCDDGNTTAGDCCSPTCQRETSAACEVYVGSPYEGSSAAVRVFLRSQSGNAAPLRVISGPTSRLATTGSGGVAVDALHDEIVVAGNFGATKEILVFDRLANGDVAPLRTIAGASTGIVDAQAVAVDPAHDEIFLVDYSGQAVRVFSRTASGNVAPIRVLSGAATGLVDPAAMAVDPEADQIYVANYVAGNILVFPRAASGNVAPLRTIAGANTLLNRPNGLALDLINDEIIAGNFHGQRVTVYSLSASGNVSPLRTISGGGSGIASTTGVGVDPVRGELFSANFDTHSLVVHSRTASGAAAPLRSLNGAATGLFRPNPLAVPRSYAGNGVLEPGEQCDDGNTVGGDCCSAAGQFESNGSACTDDGNVCTNDVCNGSGACTHPGISGSCADDGNPCTDDVCNAGTCTHPGISGSCPDDGNPCTDDVCDAGACTHPSISGSCADDGNPCTDDLCDAGACTHPSISGSCPDDGNPCTDDLCDAGTCTHPNNTAACDDGSYCNGNDSCQNGTCSVHTGNPCTGDDCRRCSAPAELVKDINTTPAGVVGSGIPIPIGPIVTIGPVSYFAAWSSEAGIELWRTDGTAAGTVMLKDIYPGEYDSIPAFLTDVNGTLFFLARDAEHGIELWKSDGTPQGTVLVKDIRVGAAGGVEQGWYYYYSHGLNMLVDVNGTLFFGADDGVHGYELWKSDGTAEGTVLVHDAHPGSVDGLSSPVSDDDRLTSSLRAAGGKLFFIAQDGTHGYELWKSDGTSAGTAMVKDINPGANEGVRTYPAVAMTVVDGVLLFVGADGVSGWELWKSDGTADGTSLVKDIHPSGDGLREGENFVAVNGTLFFGADDGTHGAEFWKSDGTAAGTVLVKDIRPGSEGSWIPSDGYNFLNAVDLNGELLFSAFDGTDVGLWRSDGSEAGTTLLRAGFWGFFDDSSVIDGELIFPGDDDATGTELWKTDGTGAGTVLVKDIIPGTYGSSPGFFAQLDGDLIFSAGIGSGAGVPPLWRSDGTSSGTEPLVDFAGGSPSTASSSPAYLTTGGDFLYFRTCAGGSCRLWKSDGSEAGTVVVKDVPGYALHSLAYVNGLLFFSVRSGAWLDGGELWKSDGTEVGTVLLEDLYESPHSLTNLDGMLLFVDRSSLWRSNGTAAGTVHVKAFNLSSYAPRWLTPVGSTLFFTAADGTNGRELWRSDGTHAGTVMVKDINPSGGSIQDFSGLVNVNGTVFFRAWDGVHGDELWKSDGTAAGTVMVKDINPSGSSSPDELVNVNGTVFFMAWDGVHGSELWKSDGTTAGTVMVKDIVPGSASTYPQRLTSAGGALFFVVNYRELWVSDGTEGGTELLKVFADSPDGLTNIGGMLYFRARDAAGGSEVWRSDGTAAGTYRLADVNPGPEGSWPSEFRAFGTDLVFTATHPAYGVELWKVPNVVRCGDGVVDPYESCDDGNSVNGDGCDNACTPSGCGNGFFGLGEQCDDGNSVDTDACKNDCTLNVCGDGVLRVGVEGCDDGNAVSGDACTDACYPALCGDGIVRTGVEICDDDNVDNGDCCSATCTAAAGNGTSCDDGNVCTQGEACSSGVCSGGSACDDGSACTVDSCVAPVGCIFSALPDNTPCNDGQFCNGTDTCIGGSCIHGGDPCTGAGQCNDTCNESADDCTAPDGTACNDGDGCPADTCQGGSCQAVSCPVVDAVVLAGKPLHVNVAAGKTTINKTLSITVRNADAVDRRIALTVDDSHCPPGLAGSPDFDPSTPAADGSVVVPAGKTKKAKLPILVQSADFESFNFKAAQRCVLHIEANAVVVGGSNDPMPDNNRARIEISVVDRNDAEQTFLHETTLNSAKPASLSIRAGMITASKVVTASIGNADYKPVVENPGDAVTLNASTTCTGLSLSAPLCDVPANSATATVKGGARKTCKLTVTADASQISTTNVKSPQRCTVTLSAAGPSQPDPEPSNNLTELVLDVLDKND